MTRAQPRRSRPRQRTRRVPRSESNRSERDQTSVHPRCAGRPNVFLHRHQNIRSFHHDPNAVLHRKPQLGPNLGDVDSPPVFQRRCTMHGPSVDRIGDGYVRQPDARWLRTISRPVLPSAARHVSAMVANCWIVDYPTALAGRTVHVSRRFIADRAWPQWDSIRECRCGLSSASGR